MHFGLLFLMCVSLEKAAYSSFKNNQRYRLLNELFAQDTDHHFSREVIPLPSNHTPILVCFQFGIYEILELNDKKQIMNLNTWMRIGWNNDFLKWNTSDFGGINSITVEKEKVWVPDITLWNRAINDDSMYQRMDTRVRIRHDGYCSWNAPVTTSSTCAIKIKDFPFDIQKCDVILGSWRHASNEIIFSLCDKPCVDKSVYLEDSEWSLDDVYGNVTDEAYYGDTTFSKIVCGLRVRRQSMFYIVNMVVPCAIITFLCCFTFYLPTNNGERISLVITVLLAMTVYMLIVADSMPPSSEGVPLVEKFYFISIIETTLCLVSTCIVVKWHENTVPMPNWIYVVFNCVLPKFLRVNQVPGGQENAKFIPTAAPVPHHSNRLSQRCKTSDILLDSVSTAENENLQADKVELDFSSHDLKQHHTVRYGREEIPRDWTLAARVLNKFFLVLFMLMFPLSMAAVFATAL